MKPSPLAGYVNPALQFYGPRPLVCIVPDCGRPVATADYCSGHYQRVRRTGDPGPAYVRPYRRKDAAP